MIPLSSCVVRSKLVFEQQLWHADLLRDRLRVRSRFDLANYHRETIRAGWIVGNVVAKDLELSA